MRRRELPREAEVEITEETRRRRRAEVGQRTTSGDKGKRKRSGG